MSLRSPEQSGNGHVAFVPVPPRQAERSKGRYNLLTDLWWKFVSAEADLL